MHAVADLKTFLAARNIPITHHPAALGFTANLGPLREWGLDLHDNRHLVVDSAMRTNVPGVYASAYGPAILALLVVAFAAARHVVAGRSERLWALGGVLALLAAMVALSVA